MFDVIWLLFSWVPSPLNIICFGGVCLLLAFAVVRIICKVIDMLPFT